MGSKLKFDSDRRGLARERRQARQQRNQIRRQARQNRARPPSPWRRPLHRRQ